MKNLYQIIYGKSPRILIIAITLASVGCATPKVTQLPSVPMIEAEIADYTVNGKTTREEVLLKFGTPSAHFENKRILTYQFRIDQNGQAILFWPRKSEIHPMFTHWNKEVYSLVLVFDQNGVLEKHQLIGAQ